jgi:hypothetical protein
VDVTALHSARLVAARTVSPLQIEDWILALWLAFAAPTIVHVEGGAGVGPSRPLDGLFWLVGLCGAALCLVSRSPDQPETTRRLTTGIAPLAAVGMFLVGAGAAAAMGIPPVFGLIPTIAAASWMSLPPDTALAFQVSTTTRPGTLFVLPAATRRALITPYLLASGSILYAIVAPLKGSADFIKEFFNVVAVAAPDAVPALIVAGMAGIFAIALAYGLFVYYPRQIVDRTGGPVVWVARFALFLVGLIFGLGWLSVLGV